MDNNGKQIIIFMRNHLGLGGIERYVYLTAKMMRDKGAQIIWVKHPRTLLDNTFEDLFYDGKTIIWNRNIHRNELEKLVRSGYNEIRIISFDLYPFVKVEEFKRSFKLCPVHNFYFVPHFTGDTLYLEEAYCGKKQERVKKRTAPIIQKMHERGNIRYFSQRHMDKMESTYDYHIENKNFYFVPPSEAGIRVFDEERCRYLATRDRFNLLTVSRFEFPHKGYLVGLIKEYGRIKKKYPRIELTIVGYGDGLAVLENEVEKLEETARKSIRFVGKVASDMLPQFYKDANLNISVAGACSQGAQIGTLSMAARHYDFNCEVYGFLSSHNTSTVVSSEPGKPVGPYIEQVLNMSEDEYCEKCKECFDAYNTDEIRMRVGMESIQNESLQSTLSTQDIIFVRWEEIKRALRGKVRKLLKIAKNLFGRNR